MSGALLLWQQVSDPIAFLHAVEGNDGWRRVGLVRVGGFLLWLVVWTVAARTDPTRWRDIAAVSLLLYGLHYIIGALFIMMTGHPQFWVAYPSTPLLMLGLGLLGLGSGSYLRFLCLAAIYIYLIGSAVAIAGILWVRSRMEWIQYRLARRHLLGPLGELPEFPLRQRVRRIRLGLFALSLLPALYWVTLGTPATATDGALGLVAGLGILRLEALLVCYAGWQAVARYHPQDSTWHLTYSGRFTLFAPPRRLGRLLTEGTKGGQLVLTLLQQGHLAASVHHAVARLSAAQAHSLVFHLSTLPGGETAIRYLRTALPRELHPLALAYTHLAEAATLPTLYRRWVAKLPDEQTLTPAAMRAIEADWLIPPLIQVRLALRCMSASPVLGQAQHDLRQAIATFESTHGPLNPSSWPLMLLSDLEQHTDICELR